MYAVQPSMYTNPPPSRDQLLIKECNIALNHWKARDRSTAGTVVIRQDFLNRDFRIYTDVIEDKIVDIQCVAFRVITVRKGIIENTGDKGWINWCIIGTNFRMEGNKVYFGGAVEGYKHKPNLIAPSFRKQR